MPRTPAAAPADTSPLAPVADPARRPDPPRRYDDAVPIDTLLPHPENPRQGDKDVILKSMDANGFFGAVLVQDRTNVIIVGQHRWETATETGRTNIPVLFLDIDDDWAMDIRLADNGTSDHAGYNEAVLLGLLEASKARNEGSLDAAGFCLEDMEWIVANADTAEARAHDDAGDAMLQVFASGDGNLGTVDMMHAAADNADNVGAASAPPPLLPTPPLAPDTPAQAQTPFATGNAVHADAADNDDEGDDEGDDDQPFAPRNGTMPPLTDMSAPYPPSGIVGAPQAPITPTNAPAVSDAESAPAALAAPAAPVEPARFLLVMTEERRDKCVAKLNLIKSQQHLGTQADALCFALGVLETDPAPFVPPAPEWNDGDGDGDEPDDAGSGTDDDEVENDGDE